MSEFGTSSEFIDSKAATIAFLHNQLQSVHIHKYAHSFAEERSDSAVVCSSTPCNSSSGHSFGNDGCPPEGPANAHASSHREHNSSQTQMYSHSSVGRRLDSAVNTSSTAYSLAVHMVCLFSAHDAASKFSAQHLAHHLLHTSA